MRRLYDALGAIIITAMVVHMLMNMIKPYVPWMLLSACLLGAGNYFYRRSRNW